MLSSCCNCRPHPAAAAVSELFGISAGSTPRPASTLAAHLRRLSGLQLWAVARYAAGRGAAADSVRRLGLAAWLSDNTGSVTAATMPYQVGGVYAVWAAGAGLRVAAWLAA